MRASKMTIITGLKYNEVETTESLGSVNVRSFSLGWLNEYPNIALTKDAEPPLQVTYTDYCIRGRRIRTPNGKEVYLGNSPVVEEFLGLQFDLFENMKKEKSDALFRLSNAEKEKSDALFKLSESQQAVEQLRGMSFLRRLKFLFTGELV